MRSLRINILLILTIAFITGCAGEAPKNSNNKTAANNSANTNSAPQTKDDVDELEMIVKLPFHPEEAVWREDDFTKPGENRPPAAKKLTVVIRFKKDDTSKIIALAEKHRPTGPESLTPENWFPAELIAQSQVSGDETLKGTSYGANDLYLGQYNDGKLIRFDGSDYFLLELFAK